MPPPDLIAALAEVEQYVDQHGWDQPPRLFALVDTASLKLAEPTLEVPDNDGLTSIEQEGVPAEGFEEFLQTLQWPAQVGGVAVVLERLVLPPGADADLPADAAAAAAYAQEHPDRQDVRIAAAVTRDHVRASLLRLRAAPDDVVTAPDLVPALLDLLAGTLEDE